MKDTEFFGEEIYAELGFKTEAIDVLCKKIDAK